MPCQAPHDVVAAMQGHQEASCANSYGKCASRGHCALRLQGCGRHHYFLRCKIRFAKLTSPTALLYISILRDGERPCIDMYALRDLPLSSLLRCNFEAAICAIGIRNEGTAHPICTGLPELNKHDRHAHTHR